MPGWHSLPVAHASPQSPELPLSLAALLKLSARNASWICDMSACSWSEASPSLSPECVFWARVCACVRVFQRGSSMWEGKKHDTCFCQCADCSAPRRPPLPPAALPFLSSQSCPIQSRDQSRFPLLLPGIQADWQAAAPDCLEAIHLAKPPHPLPHVQPPFLAIQPPRRGRQWGEVSVWLAPAIRRQEMGNSLDSSPSVALTSHLKEGRKG